MFPEAEGVRWNSQEKVPTFEALAASLTDVVDGELAQVILSYGGGGARSHTLRARRRT